MKALVIYLIGVAIAFGALAFLISQPETTASGRAFVVVDSSFPMQDVWSQVPTTLEALEEEGFEAFALATEKGEVHSWQEALRLGSTRPFAPCDFAELDGYSQAEEADERILVTTAASCPTDALSGWRVLLLAP